jgi:hypothetical protein
MAIDCDDDWTLYKVELRATPDTPDIEAQAAKQGRVLGPQTVFKWLYAHSPEEAAQKAIESEYLFSYRKSVWLFGAPTLVT